MTAGARDDIRIISTDDAHVASFHACLDAVARERRFLALVEAPLVEAMRGFVRSLVDSGGIQVLAVDADGTVVGWCDIVRHGLEGFRHTGHLGMGVLPPCRGRGVGRSLALAAIERAWAAGLERVELEVFASNEPALRLYQKLGFVVEGLKRRARKIDGRSDDLIVMALLRDPGWP
jgi:ribosomal protein S18 acetylase RimI-like enzyme